MHARTKADGYRPPAYWEQIPLIRAAVGPQIRIIANGEIWTVQDALRCREQSGCTDLMLGRGSIAAPVGPGHSRCCRSRCACCR